MSGAGRTVTCRVLNSLGKTTHRGTIIDIGGYDVQGQQMAERIDAGQAVRCGRLFAVREPRRGRAGGLLLASRCGTGAPGEMCEKQ